MEWVEHQAKSSVHSGISNYFGFQDSRADMFSTLCAAQQEAENSIYKIQIPSHPKLRKRQSKLTSNFCHLLLYSTRSLDLHYSATDVKWRKHNLESNLRLFLYFIAERKSPTNEKHPQKSPHLLQTPMLLADRAAQPSLDSHFLLTCNKHQYFVFRWKENIFYLKASKRHKRKTTDIPMPCTDSSHQ